ncbi:hypothetical protein IKA_05669 [Bacillus cereus VD169]|nr:hypothetical protein IKA_05669 [Bacillus cereus VD169]
MNFSLAEPNGFALNELYVSSEDEKVDNQRKHSLHHESKKLAVHFDFVAIVDLNMKGMSQAPHFRKSVADNGWGMFTFFLAYKLNDQEKQLIKNMTLSERVNFRICGVHLDRDYNAAINIKNEAIRLLALG